MEALSDDERDAVECEAPLITAVARMVAKGRADPDDWQAGSLGLMRAIRTFDPEAGDFGPYARRLIYNEIMDRRAADRIMPVRRGSYRKGYRAPATVPIGSLAAHPATADRGESEAIRQDVRWSVARLPPRQRQAVERSMDGLIHKQIAAEMGVGVKAIDRLSSAANRRLRKHLAKYAS